MVTWDFKRKSVKRKGLLRFKERQGRVVGPMNENHEVKIKKIRKT